MEIRVFLTKLHLFEKHHCSSYGAHSEIYDVNNVKMSTFFYNRPRPFRCTSCAFLPICGKCPCTTLQTFLTILIQLRNVADQDYEIFGHAVPTSELTRYKSPWGEVSSHNDSLLSLQRLCHIYTVDLPAFESIPASVIIRMVSAAVFFS